jgi:hypothetical protein
MKYGDFSSLVQLGVGLHAGTALLQLYGEFGLQPVERAIARLKYALSDQDAASDDLGRLSQLEAELSIFKIQLFNEYKKYMKGNLVIAGILTVCLVYIAFYNDDAISTGWALMLAVLSCIPAPITLAVLWFDAAQQIRPLRNKVSRLEDEIYGPANWKGNPASP